MYLRTLSSNYKIKVNYSHGCGKALTLSCYS